VAVASAGLYASLHLIPDNHTNIPPLSFLQAGCPSCCPDALPAAQLHNKFKENEAQICTRIIDRIVGNYPTLGYVL